MEGEDMFKNRHSREDRKVNTARRRKKKKEKQRAELEVSREGTLATNSTESYLPNEETGEKRINVETHGMEELQKLKQENNRLHKHAVYFHYKWKQSEKKSTEKQQELKELDRNHLIYTGSIGEGTFGLCYRATYGSIKVAVKEIKCAELHEGITREAQILQSLRHPNLPFLLGICFEKTPFLIVCTYHSVDQEVTSEATTIYNALWENIVGSNLRPHWLAILHDLSKAISYVHKQDIIHNDIKTNNAVVEKHGENYSAVLIDFGKATVADSGRVYPEFDENEREKYKRKYPYLAPELKSGGGRETSCSDVYSFGYLMKYVSHTVNDRELSKLYHECKNISPDDRPKMFEVEEALKKLIMKK
jgi:hypothetical protein